ncbi:hypothetical protein [Serinibacter salmoneus]|uniref:Uncharacterized protein n=1 Tax=Serinibacter salmoneus TaxID=556530 RepID=A0A2A9D4G0_9MICO|nr:hypothetical protein [Serinibacter salmoneus]PFG20739.1 hypothetical protein ATL40_2350 [Serinibacter salmoneus]
MSEQPATPPGEHHEHGEHTEHGERTEHGEAGEHPDAGPSALTPPVPPRSRARRHALGLILAILLSPAMLHLLTSGALSVIDGNRGAGLAAFVAAGLVAAGLAWTARVSAVGPAVAGSVWILTSLALEIGVLSPVVLANLLFVDLTTNNPTGAALLSGATWLVLVGGSGLAGLALIAGAMAASNARARGIRAERREADTISAGDTRTPPRHRIGAHVSAVLIGALGSATAVVAASGIAHHVVGPPERSVLAAPGTIAATILVIVLILATGSTGALSSLGQASGAVVWAVAAVATTTAGSADHFWAVIEAILSPITAMPDIAPDRLDIAGACILVALAMAGGALGTHGARREGRALERHEQELLRT